MKRGPLLALLTLAASAFGCAPPARTLITVPPPVIAPETVQASRLAEEMRARAAALEDMLREESPAQRDRETISALISAYRAVAGMAAQGCRGPDPSASLQGVSAALKRMEKLAVHGRGPAVLDPTAAISLHAAKEKEILDASSGGDHARVIALCEELRALFGPDGFTPELGAAFAVSLARQGRRREAILVAETILRDLETAPGAVAVSAELVRWHLAAGERDGAVRAYQKARDIHEEQAALLQSLGGEIVSKDGDPVGPRIPIARPEGLERTMTEVVRLPSDRFFQEIERLKGINRFEEARALLIARQGETLFGQEQDAIHNALKDLDEAEGGFLDQRVASVSETQGLREARHLIDEERYEEALSVLEKLPSAAGGEKAQDVEALKKKAIEGLIDRERNRAARLFLAARQATDRAKRDEYLRASYGVLQAVVDKYPDSPLIHKVRAHRDRVKEELEKR